MNSAASTPSSPASAVKSPTTKYYATADYKIVTLDASKDCNDYEKEFTFDTRLQALRCNRSDVTNRLTNARQSIKHWHGILKVAQNAYQKKSYLKSKQAHVGIEQELKAILADIESKIAKEST